MTTFNGFKFRFFGSSSTAKFDKAKSLHENFVRMCSLSVFYKQSRETQFLASLLKNCEIPSAENNRKNLIAKLATLELAIKAVDSWMIARQHKSIRIPQMSEFLNGLKTLRADIRNTFGSPFTFLRKGHTASLTGLDYLTIHTKNRDTGYLENYLNSKQLALLKEIEKPKTNPNPKAPESSRLLKLGMAAFMPFVNIGVDFDCFNCVLDSLSSYMGLVKVFC